MGSGKEIHSRELQLSYGFVQLGPTVRAGLDSVSLITIQRFANRARRWIDAYIAGLNEKQQVFVGNQERSHRRAMGGIGGGRVGIIANQVCKQVLSWHDRGCLGMPRRMDTSGPSHTKSLFFRLYPLLHLTLYTQIRTVTLFIFKLIPFVYSRIIHSFLVVVALI